MNSRKERLQRLNRAFVPLTSMMHMGRVLKYWLRDSSFSLARAVMS